MKILSKTKKYLHVRLSREEYALLELALEKKTIEEERKEKELEYAEWFFSNHIDINWQDEYSSWHTAWKNIHTKKEVQHPDFFTVLIYKHRFLDIIRKNRKALGYKE